MIFDDLSSQIDFDTEETPKLKEVNKTQRTWVKLKQPVICYLCAHPKLGTEYALQTSRGGFIPICESCRKSNKL